MASVLGLPRRLASTALASVDAIDELPVFQQKLLEHLDSIDRGIGRLEAHVQPIGVAVARLEARSAALEETVTDLERRVALLGTEDANVATQLSDVQVQITSIRQTVGDIATRLPGDGNANGPIAKAKEVLTGSDP